MYARAHTHTCAHINRIVIFKRKRMSPWIKDVCLYCYLSNNTRLSAIFFKSLTLDCCCTTCIITCRPAVFCRTLLPVSLLRIQSAGRFSLCPGQTAAAYSLVDSDVVPSGYSLMPGGSLGLDEGYPCARQDSEVPLATHSTVKYHHKEPAAPKCRQYHCR